MKRSNLVVASLLSLVASMALSPTAQQPEPSQSRLSHGYGAGYDGADIKAINAAWQVFVRTDGLKSADQRIERYWFRIQVDETYRIVQILPKVTIEDYPPDYTRTHWPFGTEGKFWVHKASFEVDKKEVIPPP